MLPPRLANWVIGLTGTAGGEIARPIRRYVTPVEIVNTVLFLCSDLASAITGAQYVVDGARTATGGAVTQAMQS